MAEYDIAEDINNKLFEIEATDVMTGATDRNRFLYYQLEMMQSSIQRDPCFALVV